MSATTDVALTRIDETIARLLLTPAHLPLERRLGNLEARPRLQRARVRRYRQLH